MTIEELNNLDDDAAYEALERCCGASQWVKKMSARRPFASAQELWDLAEREWWNLSAEDWKEAFSHHPKIGDLQSLEQKFSGTRNWALGEQAGTQSASEDTLRALAAGNSEYEKTFGYIFIVCATGKSASEMLGMLRARLTNTPGTELKIAAAEQAKITRLRLEKLLIDQTFRHPS